MTKNCNETRDLLPKVAAGTLSHEETRAVEEHLRFCADCRQEMEVVARIREASQEEVPAGLEARIQARLRDELETRSDLSHGSGRPLVAEGSRSGVGGLTRRWTPAWVLSAAAVVILGLGTGLLWDRNGPNGVQDPSALASQEPLPEAWLWDDGVVAGAPVLDGLSDEDLEILLEEFEG